MKERLGLVVGLVVTAVWAAAAVAGLFTGNFQGLEVVSPVMLLLAGWLFGIQIVKRKISADDEQAGIDGDRWSHLP